VAAAAHAEEAPPPESPRLALTYAAPPECPTETDFGERLAQRTRDRGVDGRILDLRRFEIRIATFPGGARADITAFDPGGRRTERRLDAATCAEAVDAAALVVALTLEEARSQPEALPPPPSPPPPIAPVQPPAITDRFSVSVAMLVLSGIAPEAVPAIGAGVRFARGNPGSVEILALAEFRYAPEAEIATPEGDARFTFTAGTAAVCAGGTPVAGGPWLGACGAVEAGTLAAGGSDTRSPRSTRNPWISAGPAASFEWPFARPLLLIGGVEALFPLRRDRFLLGETVVHEVPALSLRAEVGLGVRCF
jgi:hypothetical protein